MYTMNPPAGRQVVDGTRSAGLLYTITMYRVPVLYKPSCWKTGSRRDQVCRADCTVCTMNPPAGRQVVARTRSAGLTVHYVQYTMKPPAGRQVVARTRSARLTESPRSACPAPARTPSEIIASLSPSNEDSKKESIQSSWQTDRGQS